MQTGGTASTAYQQDGASYVRQIAKTFGAYKKRALDFLDVRPGMRVLDVGCGAGDDALLLASFVGPGGSVTGIDVSAEMVRAARERARAAGAVGVEFAECDACRLPFGDGVFDRVRADRVFQHLGDPERALREMARVTAAGGVVGAVDVDWASLVVVSDDEATGAAILQFLAAAQRQPRAGSSLYGMFRRAGLSGVQCYADAVAVTDLSVALWAWGLDVYARKAAEAGRVTAAQAEAWLSGLSRRDSESTFFGSMTGVSVRGSP